MMFAGDILRTGHDRGYGAWPGRFLVLALLFLLATGCTKLTPLEREITSLDLKGGVVVYGVRGQAPSVLRLGGEPEEKYPLWSLSKPITASRVILPPLRNTPPDPYDARDRLIPLLLELQKRPGG